MLLRRHLEDELSRWQDLTEIKRTAAASAKGGPVRRRTQLALEYADCASMHAEPTTTTSEPVFWWWREEEGARVVLLTDEVLLVSSPLSDAEMFALETARRHGNVLGAELGPEPIRVDLPDVKVLRYVPGDHRILIQNAGGTELIAPPEAQAGIAAGIFEVLRRRLAPDAPVQEIVHRARKSDTTLDTPLMAGLAVFGLVCLGLSIRADKDTVITGRFEGLRNLINDLFVAVGFAPTIVALLLMGVVQYKRSQRSVPVTRDLANGTLVHLVEVAPTRPRSVEPVAGSIAPFSDSQIEDQARSEPELDAVGEEPVAEVEVEVEPVLEAELEPEAEPAVEQWGQSRSDAVGKSRWLR